MPEFDPTNAGVRLTLDQAETHLVRQLTAELRAMLAGGRFDRGDPVYDRLFPSAYDDDADEAAYRDLIGDDLTTHKLEALDAVSTALGPRETDVTLDDEALGSWLTCLTDLRLAIGSRLDVDEQRMGAEISPEDPDAQALAVLHWLGWVQEGMIEAAAALQC